MVTNQLKHAFQSQFKNRINGMSDNFKINVSGQTKEQLLTMVKYAFRQRGQRTKCRGWKTSKRNGLVLYWHNNGNINSVKDFDAESTTELIWDWLIGLNYQEFVEMTPLDGNDCDHDGFNERGWLLSVDDWGHVRSECGNAIDHHTLFKIQPYFHWYGK